MSESYRSQEWVKFSEATPPAKAVVQVRRVEGRRGLFEDERPTLVEFVGAFKDGTGVSVQVVGLMEPIKCVADKWEWQSIEQEEGKGRSRKVG